MRSRESRDWETLVARERSRYEDGSERNAPEQLVRIGNAAYGAGLALLMLGRGDEAEAWLLLAASRWRESWEHATPTSWGRPIGAIKAALIAGRDDEASVCASWAVTLGPAESDSPIGRYAAALALLVLGRDPEALTMASSLQSRDDFPADVADALACIAAGDGSGSDVAIRSVLASFESRQAYLEDVPVADTVLVLQRLAELRGIAGELPSSALLPG